VFDEPLNVLEQIMDSDKRWRLVVTISIGGEKNAFTQLDDRTVKHIFGYVGRAYDLLSCERTCNRFRSILKDDDVWRHSECPCVNSIIDAGESYRERSFYNSVIKGVREEQKNSRNIILSVLSPDQAKSQIFSLLYELENHYVNCPHRLEIRGDTLGYLLELIEDYMLRKLDFIVRNGIKPTEALSMKDWENLNRILREFSPILTYRMNYDFTLTENVRNQCSYEERTQIVRRLANRAGIVSMTNEFMETVFFDTFKLAAILIHGPIISQHKASRETQAYGPDDEVDLWYDIPPVARVGDSNQLEFVIVPNAVDEYGKMLGLLPATCYSSVYGHVWALSDGQSLDEEIIKAKQRYKIGLADDDSYVLYAAEIEDEIIDQQSMSCSSESDAFDEDTISIYDDDECPDALVEDGEYIPKNTPFLPAP